MAKLGFRWISLLRQPIGPFQLGALFTALFGVVCALSVPQKVTVDGILYISSAKSLFSKDFVSFYASYREPGYPLFLWLIHQLGNAALYVCLIQGAMLGLALYLTYWSLRWVAGHKTVEVWAALILLLLGLNPMFISYAGLFLQQAAFTLVLSLFVITTALTIRPLGRKRWVTPFSAILIYLLGILLSIGWMYLGLIPTIFAISGYIFQSDFFQTSRPRFIKSLLKIGVVLGTSAFTYFIGSRLFDVWKTFKESVIHEGTISKAVIEPLSKVPYIPTPVEMYERIISIMHFKTIPPYVFENDLFMHAQMRLEFPQSEYDTAYTLQPFTGFAPGYFELTNPSLVLHSLLSIASPIAGFIYTAMMLVLVVGALYFAATKQFSLSIVLGVGFQFVFVYAASNSPIDRYGIPIFPLAIAVFLTLIELVILRTKRRFVP